jgi:hypothetical protein
MVLRSPAFGKLQNVGQNYESELTAQAFSAGYSQKDPIETGFTPFVQVDG